MLWLSQEKYVTKVLQRFSVGDVKQVGLTLPANCKFSGKQSSQTKAEKAEMMEVPCASIVRSLMYAMYVLGRTSDLQSE